MGDPRLDSPGMNPPGGDSAYLSARDVDSAADYALVERMRDADEQALAELYDRWCRPVYALVSQLVGDPDDADDVLEETFYQAWRHANRYEPSRGTVGTWILTIARSRALDRVRARRRLREEPLAVATEGLDERGVLELTASVDPSMGAEDSERRERIRAALAMLPPEQRQVLELAYFGGLTQAEIAEHTGQPLGTVKTRMRLAGQKLREQLSEYRGMEAQP